jgi:hypothetical protein
MPVPAIAFHRAGRAEGGRRPSGAASIPAATVQPRPRRCQQRLAKRFGDLPREIRALEPFPGTAGKLVPDTTDVPDGWRTATPGYRAFTFRELMHPEGR